ncbi:MBG domain-containing protein [Bifidobacterium crudilactis]|jgi:archaellum component FlaC|uniref:MBG domain-containing protein n=1 Tax=Bifidobacterium crudilactis TaxID=327277 RepID=UPI002F3605FE
MAKNTVRKHFRGLAALKSASAKALGAGLACVLLVGTAVTPVYADTSDDLKSSLTSTCVAQLATSDSQKPLYESICTQIVDKTYDALTKVDPETAMLVMRQVASSVAAYAQEISEKVLAGDLALEDVDDDIKQTINNLIDEAGELVKTAVSGMVYEELYTSHIVDGKPGIDGSNHTSEYWQAYDAAYPGLLAQMQDEQNVGAAQTALDAARNQLNAAVAALSTLESLTGAGGLINQIAEGSTTYTNGQIADSTINALLKALQDGKTDLVNFDANKAIAQQKKNETAAALAAAQKAVTDKGWTLGSCLTPSFAGGHLGSTECNKLATAIANDAAAAGVLETYSDAARSAKEWVITQAVTAASNAANSAVSSAKAALGTPADGGNPATGLYKTLADAQAVLDNAESTAEEQAAALSHQAGLVAEQAQQLAASTAAEAISTAVASAVTSALHSVKQQLFDAIEEAAKQIADAVNAALDAAAQEAKKQLEEIRSEIAKIQAELQDLADQVEQGVESTKQRYAELLSRLDALADEARNIAGKVIDGVNDFKDMSVAEAQAAVNQLLSNIQYGIAYVQSEGFREDIRELIEKLLKQGEAVIADNCSMSSAVIRVLIDRITALDTEGKPSLSAIASLLLDGLNSLKERVDALCPTTVNLQVWTTQSADREYIGTSFNTVTGTSKVERVYNGHAKQLKASEYSLAYKAASGANADISAAAGDWVASQAELQLNQAGSYTIFVQATYNGDTAIGKVNFTITPASITITAHDASKKFAETDPTFGYSITQGTLLGSDTITGTLTRTAGENVGTYDILEPEGGFSNPNYDITFVKGTFTIKNNQSIGDVSDAIDNLPDKVTTRKQADLVAQVTVRFEALSQEERAQLPQSLLQKLARLQQESGVVNAMHGTIGIAGLPWYVRVIVDEQDLDDDMRALFSDAIGERELTALFDIHLVNTLTGDEYRLPDGQSVTVSINDSELAKRRNMVIAHQLEDGSIELLDAKANADGSAVEFTTHSFSLFGHAAAKLSAAEQTALQQAKAQAAVATSTTKLARTGADIALALYLVGAMAIIGGAITRRSRLQGLNR